MVWNQTLDLRLSHRLLGGKKYLLFISGLTNQSARKALFYSPVKYKLIFILYLNGQTVDSLGGKTTSWKHRKYDWKSVYVWPIVICHESVITQGANTPTGSFVPSQLYCFGFLISSKPTFRILLFAGLKFIWADDHGKLGLSVRSFSKVWVFSEILIN